MNIGDIVTVRGEMLSLRRGHQRVGQKIPTAKAGGLNRKV